MGKYKILLTCYDFGNSKPYLDEVTGVFTTYTRARCEMLHCVLDELESLNGIMEDDTFPERRFISTMENEHHDVVINAWDGPDYSPVTCYNVMTQANLLKKLNKMLKERHGYHITVKLKCCIDDNGNTQYYFTSRQYGDGDTFDRAVDAYYDADDYLCGIGEIY